MKSLVLVVFLFSMAVTVSGQAPAVTDQEAGLKILRLDLQRTTVKGPAVRAVAPTDPAYQKNAKTDRLSDSDSDVTPALHRMGQNAEVAPRNITTDEKGNPRASRSDINSAPTKPSVVYVASIVVQNIGTKTVTAVHWEYMLFEEKATEPVKRYRVQTKRTIEPGQQTELTKEVTPKGREQQARLIRIEYSDGSVWEPSPKPADTLKN